MRKERGREQRGLRSLWGSKEAVGASHFQIKTYLFCVPHKEHPCTMTGVGHYSVSATSGTSRRGLSMTCEGQVLFLV